MMEAKGVARLYRAMDEKDSKILTSADTNILSMHSMNSEEKLPMPSKALRLLSTYLVQKTCIGENGYLAGKQLFKMTAVEIAGENGVTESRSSKEQVISPENFKDLDIDQKLDTIYRILLERSY